jgi:hypothetical protein
MKSDEMQNNSRDRSENRIASGEQLLRHLDVKLTEPRDAALAIADRYVTLSDHLSVKPGEPLIADCPPAPAALGPAIVDFERQLLKAERRIRRLTWRTAILMHFTRSIVVSIPRQSRGL